MRFEQDTRLRSNWVVACPSGDVGERVAFLLRSAGFEVSRYDDLGEALRDLDHGNGSAVVTPVPTMSDNGRSAIPSLRSALRQFERLHIERILKECDWNKTEAANRLSIGLSSLYRKIDELNITRERNGTGAVYSH